MAMAIHASETAEPRGMTLSDLVALVIGVAVVVWLPWGSWPEFVRSVGPSGWISDPQAWAILAEVLGKACLAMVPVVIARRLHYGGPMRPGEFLAACGGLPWLSWCVERILFLEWLRRRLGSTPNPTRIPAGASRQWVDLVYWPWHLSLIAIACLALLVILIGRKRWPSWILATAIMLAWIGVRDSGMSVARRLLFDLLAPLGRAGRWTTISAIYHTVWYPPFLMLYVWPAVLAVLGPHRYGQKRTWIQWVCIILALAVFSSEIGNQMLGRYVHTKPFRIIELGLDVASLSITIFAAFALYHRSGSAWHPIDTMAYDGDCPSSSPSRS